MSSFRRTRQFGLRTRIIAAFTLLSVLIAGGTAAAVGFTVQRWIYSNAQSMAVNRFDMEVAQLAGAYYDSLTDLKASLPPDVTAVYDSEIFNTGSAKPGDIAPEFAAELAASGNLREDDSEPPRSQRVSINRVLIGTNITVADRDGIKTVQLYSIRPLPGVKTKITELATVIIVSFIVAIAVCVLVGSWFATLLVRPLKELDRAAKQAADGDLTVRLPTGGITELAQLTASFNYMVEQHGLSLNQLRRFVADVSHELRTPLAALVPMAEVLREDIDDLPTDSTVAARLVTTEVTKLARLVDDLMEISRHDSRGAELHLEHIDLTELVADVLSTRGWTESVAVQSPRPVLIEGDRRRLDVVLANLVGNALRHGQPPVTVTISATADSAQISVHDHGAGIPDDHISRIFDRFYKADAARTRSEGSGLGLSLTLENVNLHGGTIGVVSRSGSTTFAVSLPRSATAARGSALIPR